MISLELLFHTFYHRKEQEYNCAIQKNATRFSNTLRSFAYFTATQIPAKLKFTSHVKTPTELFVLTGCNSVMLHTRVLGPSTSSSVFEISNTDNVNSNCTGVG